MPADLDQARNKHTGTIFAQILHLFQISSELWPQVEKIREKLIPDPDPDPGSRGKKAPDPQHWLLLFFSSRDRKCFFFIQPGSEKVTKKSHEIISFNTHG
jgi:hypothetical protein